MNGRTALLATGIAVTGVGLALTVDPAPARMLPVSRETLVVVGGVTLLGGVFLLERRRSADRDRAETGDPETLPELPVPGDDFRADLRHAGGLRGSGSKETVRDRLREAAVAVVGRREDCSSEEARRIVDAGEWTDDEFAAAFVGDDLAFRPRIPLDAWLRIESPFVYRARRTVAAIVELAGMEAAS